MLILGIDLGGTFAKLGLVQGDDGSILHRAKAALTDRSPEAVVLLLYQTANQLLQDADHKWDDVAALGIGCPGHVKDGIVLGASNLPSWKNVPLVKFFHEATGKPTALMNDADAAVLAEAWIGAAKGYQNIIMITLGTGVGTGVVVDGKAWTGSRGLVEGGHHIIEKDGRVCGCGQRGCLDVYASATAVVQRAKEALKQGEVSSLASILRSDEEKHEGEELTAKHVFEAAQAGDTVAQKVVDETADYLGLGCLNLCRMFDPQVLVFAGGMTAAGDYLLDKVKASFKKRGWTILGNEIDMVIAQLGPEVTGVVGAAVGAKALLSFSSDRLS